MPRYEVTPWRTRDELIRVREQLYGTGNSEDGEERDERREGVSTITMWAHRGNLPHVILASGLLVDAGLFEESIASSVDSSLPQTNTRKRKRNSPPDSTPTSSLPLSPATTSLPLRATYATAFSRFVTLLLDTASHSLPSLPSQSSTTTTPPRHSNHPSMHTLARHLSLPPSFVELRNDIAHRELPSLLVLREACKRALRWLWTFYWEKLSTPDAPQERAVLERMEGRVRELEGVLEGRVRGVLSAFVKAEGGVERKDEGGKGGMNKPTKKGRRQGKLPPQHPAKGADDAIEATTKKLLRIGGSGTGGMNVLIRVLLETTGEDSAFLLRKSGDDLPFEQFTPLLSSLSTHHPPFFPALLSALLTHLSPPLSHPHTPSAYEWLIHLLLSPRWLARTSLPGVVDWNGFIHQALTRPGEWTVRLVRRLLGDSEVGRMGGVGVWAEALGEAVREGGVVWEDADADADGDADVYGQRELGNGFAEASSSNSSSNSSSHTGSTNTNTNPPSNRLPINPHPDPDPDLQSSIPFLLAANPPHWLDERRTGWRAWSGVWEGKPIGVL